MRNLTVPLSDILTLARFAEAYGYDHPELLAPLAVMTGWVSDTEIFQYANSLSPEHQESAQSRLIRWRDRYCTPAMK